MPNFGSYKQKKKLQEMDNNDKQIIDPFAMKRKK